MTLTLELPKSLEALLQADAEREQKPIEAVLVSRVSSWYKLPDASDPVAIEAIRESLEDTEAGREMDLEEYISRRKSERKARRTGQGVK